MKRAALAAVLLLAASSAAAATTGRPYVIIKEMPRTGDADWQPVFVEGGSYGFTLRRVTDPDSGGSSAKVTVTLSIRQSPPPSSRWFPFPPATPGVDVTLDATTFVWEAGDRSDKYFTVSVAKDGVPEPHESFVVVADERDDAGQQVFVEPGGGFNGFNALIFDDDVPALSISAPATVSESAGTVSFVVTPNYAGTRPFSVQFNTSFGTALEGIDFAPVSGTLLWNANDVTARTFIVSIVPRTGMNQNRAFTAWLTTPANATVATTSAEVTITDDPSLAGVPSRRRAVRKN